MCNALLKTVIKFKLKFLGFLTEKEVFRCPFHLNVIFASLSGPKMPPFIDTYIVVLMLAFGLETVRKLCYFLPIFNDSCFTSVFGNDNVKQTNKQPVVLR